MLAAQKESESKELVAKLHQERMDGTFQRDMLQYLIRDKVDIDIDDSLLMQHNGETNPVINEMVPIVLELAQANCSHLVQSLHI